MDIEEQAKSQKDITLELLQDDGEYNIAKLLDFVFVPGSMFRYRVWPIIDAYKGDSSMDADEYTTFKIAQYTSNSVIEGARFYIYLHVISYLF